MAKRIFSDIAYMATLIATAYGPTVGSDIYDRHHSSRINSRRTKSRKTTTVAAMKREAKKRRDRRKSHG